MNRFSFLKKPQRQMFAPRGPGNYERIFSLRQILSDKRAPVFERPIERNRHNPVSHRIRIDQELDDTRTGCPLANHESSAPIIAEPVHTTTDDHFNQLPQRD